MSVNFLPGVGLDTNIFKKDSLILTHQDGQADGSFVLQFLLSEFIRFGTGREGGETKTLLILNHQSTTHWVSIASKLGYNIQRMKENGQLRILDLLQSIYEFLVSDETVLGKETQSESVLDVTGGCLSLDRLLSKSVEEVDILYPQAESSRNEEGKENKKNLLILVEDFSSLIQSSGVSDKFVLDFLRRLRFLRPDLEISLLTLVYSREEDSGGKYFSNLLSQALATTTFHVSQLKTGFSSEVHGILRVEEQDKVIPRSTDDTHHHHQQGKRLSRSYHYKLLDRGIQFIPL